MVSDGGLMKRHRREWQSKKLINFIGTLDDREKNNLKTCPLESKNGVCDHMTELLTTVIDLSSFIQKYVWNEKCINNCT